MAHLAASVTRVKDPGDGLGEAIGRIDDTWNMDKMNITSLFPILNCEMLDIDMPRAHGRASGIDHLDDGFVVFLLDRSGTSLRKTEFAKDGTEVFGNFGSFDGGKKFGLGARSSSDRLSMTTICNDTSSNEKAVASSRTTVTEIIGVGHIDESTKLKRRCAGRERWKLSIIFGESEWNVGHGEVWSGAPVDNTPIKGVAKVVKGKSFQALIVDLRGSSGEFGKGGNSIADIGARSDVGIQNLTKQRAVGEPHLFGERGMVHSMLGETGSGVDRMVIRFRKWFEGASTKLAFSGKRRTTVRFREEFVGYDEDAA